MISATALLLGSLFAAGSLAPHPLQDEIDRLLGHRVATNASSYEILSAAGEGKPWVGCVRKKGKQLFLATESALYALAGPLAISRIAGPDYKVWIIGDVDANKQIYVRRIGILAGSAQAICPRTPTRSSE